MTRTKIAITAALMSAAALMPTMAEAQFSEPAAYQAAHSDRGVLNGGQLTPAARGALGQQGTPVMPTHRKLIHPLLGQSCAHGIAASIDKYC